MVALIFVDSNIWIFLNVETYPEHLPTKVKISSLRQQGFAANVIVISEVFHKLSLLLGKREALMRGLKILESRDVAYLPIEDETVRDAIRLSLEKNIRINDALIAQQCLDMKVPILTDNLKDFKKVKGLKIIPLRRKELTR